MYGLIFVPFVSIFSYTVLDFFFENLDMGIKGDVEKPLLKTKTGLVLIVIMICRKKCCFFSVTTLCDIFSYFKSNNSQFTSAISVQYTCTLTFRYIYKRLTNACKCLTHWDPVQFMIQIHTLWVIVCIVMQQIATFKKIINDFPLYFSVINLV